MPGSLLEKRRRLPRHPCSLCGRERITLRLLRLRGSWLCAPCLREHLAPGRRSKGPAGLPGAAPDAHWATARAANATSAGEPARSDPASRGAGGARGNTPDPDLLLSLQLVDAGFRYGGLVLRLVLYGALYALAETTGPGPQLMAGFLLADGVTWMFGALIDLRIHRLAVVAETLFFAFLFWLWLRTGWSFPEDLADRAVLGLAAFATFTAKTTALVTRLMR